ncbi:MAG: gliding motility protein GldL [Bacteroidales bacterium]|nr:gliding motility protein GldL [Bacteroidales bacterium]MCF8345032.1 gliding motility protein GldL [Bacteroidales bacterium]MCF8351916.1 gliding motility protein GldL [Bacteroidales bacterium]MCF8376451.1 gliding motility protein GldL [Bacteroidales bacterium]MCF8400570.1 gliding motility protein GldL [Bacteroidales bacterium]
MGLNNIVRTRGFRNFMAKLYGWGASVVILGALFKINHYQGADIMLIIGLGTESIIFFFSAFEPPYVEPDWSIVYPELAGLYHGKKGGKKQTQLAQEPTKELDKMFKEADISQDVIDRLGDGLRKFGDNASRLSEVSNASVATNEYVENIQKASKSAAELTSSYNKTSETLSKDASASTEYVDSIKKAATGASSLSSAYESASENIKKDLAFTSEFSNSIKEATNSAKALTEKYNKSSEALTKSAQALDFSEIEGQAYNEQMKKIADNLAALNTVYELQLQKTNEQVESAAKLQETMNKFLGNLGDSADKTVLYKEQLDRLTESVASLNKVYGNMLSAMNVNPKG